MKHENVNKYCLEILSNVELHYLMYFKISSDYKKRMTCISFTWLKPNQFITMKTIVISER